MFIQALAVAAMLSGGAPVAAESAQAQELRVAPGGSYRNSCNGAFTNRGRLYANCRDNRGNFRGTSIELNRCSDFEIRNDNGLLVCGPVRGRWENDNSGGGDWGGGGGGWGRNSITVFRDSNFRGASMRFDGEISNLANSGMNDAISSFRLRGAWEMCTDAHFRGECRVFRGDVTNLRSTGMNDRISSLRPLRGGR